MNEATPLWICSIKSSFVRTYLSSQSRPGEVDHSTEPCFRTAQNSGRTLIWELRCWIYSVSPPT
jgi:hypothetical protein